VLQEAGELAAVDHAGLIDHDHRPIAEGFMATVEIARSRSQVATSSNPSPCRLRVAIPVGAAARSR
jgi:hypothetical protein